jgi:hypothetical protein
LLCRRALLACLVFAVFPGFASAQQATSLPDAPTVGADQPADISAVAPNDLPAPELQATAYQAPAYQALSSTTEPDLPAFTSGPRSDFDTNNPLVADLHSETVNLTPLIAKLYDADRSYPATSEQLEGNEHYHWRALLWQSFAFFSVENSFRLMNDPSLRYLTADKPFWHDYVGSLHHWNMNRWSDGDDFLVAWVGHPMQGSVTEFIEIQNSPRYRAVQMGDPGYLKSRFIALLYATAYSTDQKVGVLGETAIGSEGGYTYVIGCDFPCPTYNPSTLKVTNNTGWVKLVSTPLGGTLWTMTEDFIDHYISNRLQEAYPDRLAPKIFRGAINPSRTMANALRGRNPWYRDYQHLEDAPRTGFWESGSEELMQNLPRYEFYPHADFTSMVVNDSDSCLPCRHTISAPGIGFGYLLSRWWDVEADVNHHDNTSPLPSTRAGGNSTVGTFGVGYGFRTPNYGLKVSLRPGFLSYSNAYMSAPISVVPYMNSGPRATIPLTSAPELGRITHFTTVLAISGDYGLGRHFAVRSSFGNSPVRYYTFRYDRAPGVGTWPYYYWISPKIYATNENWAYQVGPVLRF